MRTVRLDQFNQGDVISNAIGVLEKGGIVIYPTETCYGVGVDATNKKAVQKLLSYKARPEGKAIAIAVSDQKMAERFVVLNKTARHLYRTFLPGPLTVISNRSRKDGSFQVAAGLAAEDGSLGVRMPDYAFTRELIKSFGKPITATSANVTGRKTPYLVDDVLNNTSKKRQHIIDLIIDAGTLPKNPPSTVVDTRMNNERVLRKGVILFGSTSHKTYSEEETRKCAACVMQEHLPMLSDHFLIFALSGELGAGKTQFVKGIARALRIQENVTSPTFVLVKEYMFQDSKSNQPRTNTSRLYHIDAWRMRMSQELFDLGFEKMLKPGNVIAIEWVEKVRALIGTAAKRRGAHVIWVRIDDQEGTRKIRIME